jgi:hypothetical protein
MKIGHCTQVSGVSGENARSGLKPMLGEGFTTPDNVQKKRAIFIVFYEVWIRNAGTFIK